MLFDADDERLTEGFPAYEAECTVRWTDGGAGLPAAAFARFDQGGDERKIDPILMLAKRSVQGSDSCQPAGSQ
jgi:hypothetical protein